MSSILKLEKIQEGYFKVYYENDVYMGDFLQKEDGFYDWWPMEFTGGYISEGILLALHSELNRLNKEWDGQINAYFDKCK